MKRLTLVRHAKSSWKDLAAPDAERPLNRRGKRDAPRMGARFATRHGDGGFVLVTSPAKRARATARAFAEACDYRAREIRVEPGLYDADAQRVVAIAAALPDDRDHVVFFGHNPGLTDFVNQATRHFLENLPTCAIAELHFDIDSWAELPGAAATLAEYDYPKKGEDLDET